MCSVFPVSHSGQQQRSVADASDAVNCAHVMVVSGDYHCRICAVRLVCRRSCTRTRLGSQALLKTERERERKKKKREKRKEEENLFRMNVWVWLLHYTLYLS